MVRWEEKQVNIIQAESIFYRKNEIEHIHVMDSQKDVIRDDRFNWMCVGGSWSIRFLKMIF